MVDIPEEEVGSYTHVLARCSGIVTIHHVSMSGLAFQVSFTSSTTTSDMASVLSAIPLVGHGVGMVAVQQP